MPAHDAFQSGNEPTSNLFTASLQRQVIYKISFRDKIILPPSYIKDDDNHDWLFSVNSTATELI